MSLFWIVRNEYLVTSFEIFGLQKAAFVFLITMLNTLSWWADPVANTWAPKLK